MIGQCPSRGGIFSTADPEFGTAGIALCGSVDAGAEAELVFSQSTQGVCWPWRRGLAQTAFYVPRTFNESKVGHGAKLSRFQERTWPPELLKGVQDKVS